MVETPTLMAENEIQEVMSAGEEAGFGALSTEKGNLPLRSLSVNATVAGLVSRVVIKQVFCNPFSEPLEATYLFPLPERAAVMGFSMTVAGRRVEGKIKERGQARQEYEEALQEGKRAAITEEERPGLFTLRVGNLLPGEEATVEFCTAELLPCEHGEVTFRFPLVVAPRYIPGNPLPGESVGDGVSPDTDVVPDASRITPPVLLEGFPNPVRLSLSVEVYPAEMPLTLLRSSLHTVVTKTEGAALRIELSPGERLNRDFILRFSLADKELRSSLFFSPDPEGEEGTFFSLIVPPVTAQSSPPLDIVFLLDRSGSMRGWKMSAARAALAEMVYASLRTQDRFTIFAFDDQIETFSSETGELVYASYPNRRRAIRFLNKIEARGGTEMAAPLRIALDVLHQDDKERLRVLVLITDGQVGNEDQLIQTVGGRVYGTSTRIFTIGIDQAVNASFLERLATLGGGRCALVESEDRLLEAMGDLRTLFGPPVLEDVSLELEGASLIEGSMVPEQIPDLFAGGALWVLGRYRGTPEGSAVLRGKYPDGAPWCQIARGQRVERPEMACIWAQGRVRALENRYTLGFGRRDELEKEIVETSLRFGVISRFTAFTALDHAEVVNPGGKLHRMVQPVEAPAGWEKAATAPLPRPRRYSDNRNMTRAGTIKGTPYYLSPEQVQGIPLGFQSDIFSLGVILYEALAGERLFSAASMMETLMKIIQWELPSTLLDPRLQAFEPILRKALAKQPADRYASMQDFKEELHRLRTSEKLPPVKESLGAYLTRLFAEREKMLGAVLLPSVQEVPYGPYLLVRKLGEGEHGTTWLARQQTQGGLSRDVVIKRLSEYLSEEERENLLCEMRLSHPGFAEVFETGQAEDGSYFIAMEFVNGKTLKEVFAFAARSGERMPPELVAWLFSQLAEALSYLHGLGVVHEDLRPEKILLGYQDEVKLTDLGPAPTPAFLPPRVGYQAGVRWQNWSGAPFLSSWEDVPLELYSLPPDLQIKRKAASSASNQAPSAQTEKPGLWRKLGRLLKRDTESGDAAPSPGRKKNFWK